MSPSVGLIVNQSSMPPEYSIEIDQDVLLSIVNEFLLEAELNSILLFPTDNISPGLLCVILIVSLRRVLLPSVQITFIVATRASPSFSFAVMLNVPSLVPILGETSNQLLSSSSSISTVHDVLLLTTQLCVLLAALNCIELVLIDKYGPSFACFTCMRSILTVPAASFHFTVISAKRSLEV